MHPESLEDLLVRWEEAREAGRPLTPEELCRDHPQWLEPLREKIAALQRLDWLTHLAESTGSGAGIVLGIGDVPLPGFRLEKLLGRGGSGEVWRARKEDGTVAALKILPRGAEEGDPEALRRLQELNHPHLAAPRTITRTDHWLILELEEADESLHDRWLSRRRAGQPGLPEDELRRFLTEAAAALDFLHEQGLHHRDIKPQNLLLVRGTLQVADFGLVKHLPHSITGHTGALTIAYAPPENFRGRTARHSDQYALAVTYCQLRGGRLPFVGTPAEVMAGHLHRPPDLSMLPPEERPVVERALAKDPARRWPSCTEFATRLFEETGKPPSVFRSGRFRFLLAGAILLVGSLMVLALASMRPTETAPESNVPETVFVFDGKSRIVTPLERFAPVTLETWVYLEQPEPGDADKYLIGSDISSKNGICLGLLYHFRVFEHPPRLMAMTLPNPLFADVTSNRLVPHQRRCHLAAVFGEKETRLFFDGRQVGEGHATRQEGGTPFVLGCAGKDNPKHHFTGKMRGARITRGERYRADFSPQATFTPDPETVLLYSPAAVDGTKVRDLSGHGNDGVLEGVRVEKSEG